MRKNMPKSSEKIKKIKKIELNALLKQGFARCVPYKTKWVEYFEEGRLGSC